jgi:hypothetical protein
MRGFDAWLTTQPDDYPALIEQPDVLDAQDFPIGEWYCRDCDEPLGFHLCGEDSGAWTDYWELTEDLEVRVCCRCYDSWFPDIDEPTPCSGCGQEPGDEHLEGCPT